MFFGSHGNREWPVGESRPTTGFGVRGRLSRIVLVLTTTSTTWMLARCPCSRCGLWSTPQRCCCTQLTRPHSHCSPSTTSVFPRALTGSQGQQLTCMQLARFADVREGTMCCGKLRGLGIQGEQGNGIGNGRRVGRRGFAWAARCWNPHAV